MHLKPNAVGLTLRLVGTAVLFSSGASASIRLIKCEGEGSVIKADSTMQVIPKRAFYFKFDDYQNSVIWAIDDSHPKISILQVDSDHLTFSAETPYRPNSSFREKYVFTLNRNSGHGTVDYINPIFPQTDALYGVTCEATEKAL